MSGSLYYLDGVDLKRASEAEKQTVLIEESCVVNTIDVELPICVDAKSREIFESLLLNGCDLVHSKSLIANGYCSYTTEWHSLILKGHV